MLAVLKPETLVDRERDSAIGYPASRKRVVICRVFRPAGLSRVVLEVAVSCGSGSPIHFAGPMNQVFPDEHSFYMYLSNCWHGVVIELSLCRHEGRVDKLVDRKPDVSLYRLDRVCHKSAFATELIAELRDVRLKEVELRLEFAAHSSNHMIHTPGVVGGVPGRCRGISLGVYVGVNILVEKRVQEVSGHAIDWCISGSRM